MRKVILMLFPAVVSGSVMAEWVKISENPLVTYYADPSTIHKNGNRVKMWGMMVYSKPMSGLIMPDDGFQYSSTKHRNEYDCKEDKTRTLILEFFTGLTAEGYPIQTNIARQPSPWKMASPGTAFGDLLNFACGKH